MRIDLVLGSVLVLSALHPVAAQISEKEAIAQVKAATKAQVKAFKQNAAAALTTLDASLDTLDDLLTESTDAATVASQFTGMAIEYMASINEAYVGAKSLVADAASLSLDALADGGDLQGLYPEDFSYGSGGALDKARAQLQHVGIKSRDAAQKRLAKSAALAEKVAHVAITCRLDFPQRANPQAVNQGDSPVVSQACTLDVVVGVSDLDVADDGILLFAGATAETGTDVTVGYTGPAFASEIATTDPDPGTGRFLGVFTSLPEGGYAVFANQTASFPHPGVGEIGVR
jgi:hypothetical protein